RRHRGVGGRLRREPGDHRARAHREAGVPRGGLHGAHRRRCRVPRSGGHRMTLLKSEWIKLTTTQSAYWLYGLAIVFAVGLGAIVGQFEQVSAGGAPAFALMGVTVSAVFLVWIAAIVWVAGEYRYHTLKATFLVAPARWPAIVTKTARLTVASMLVTAVSIILAFVVAGGLSGV